jgi:hypothetical protein
MLMHWVGIEIFFLKPNHSVVSAHLVFFNTVAMKLPILKPVMKNAIFSSLPVSMGNGQVFLNLLINFPVRRKIS